MWKSPPDRASDALLLLRRTERIVRELAEKARGSDVARESTGYWTGEMENQLESWLTITDRYLAWIEILAEKTEEDIAGLDPDVLPAFRQALQHAPSLLDLAHGNIACIASLQAIREKTPENEHAPPGLDRPRYEGLRKVEMAGR